MLDRLHALGARIALDDFGTGYSSLSYLDALPVRLVKTDRSFIEKVTDAHTVPPLVAAIANLCTTLGLTGVAEGIGTDQQYAAARNHGYRLGQGYLLGEPQPASHLTTRLHTACRPRPARPARSPGHAQTPGSQPAILSGQRRSPPKWSRSQKVPSRWPSTGTGCPTGPACSPRPLPSAACWPSGCAPPASPLAAELLADAGAQVMTLSLLLDRQFAQF